MFFWLRIGANDGTWRKHDSNIVLQWMEGLFVITYKIKYSRRYPLHAVNCESFSKKILQILKLMSLLPLSRSVIKGRVLKNSGFPPKKYRIFSTWKNPQRRLLSDTSP